MRLEYGKKYKTRDGEIVGPLARLPDNADQHPDYQFYDQEYNWTWTKGGNYWRRWPGYLAEEYNDRDIVEEVTEEPASRNPYTRTLPTYPDGTSDIYCVLKGYNVTDPAIAHAVKKLLVPGCRSGGKSYTQDLEEAMQSIQKAIDLGK